MCLGGGFCAPPTQEFSQLQKWYGFKTEGRSGDLLGMMLGMRVQCASHNSHSAALWKGVLLQSAMQHGPEIPGITVLSASRVAGNTRHMRQWLAYTSLTITS